MTHDSPPSFRDHLIRFAPWVVAALCLIYVGMKFAPGDVTTDQGMKVGEFAQLPVSYGGRFQPWDSVARNQLLVISGRTSLEHEGEKLSAIRWLLDVKAEPERARSFQMFRIDQPGVKDVLGLGEAARDETRFSLAEIEPAFGELERQAQLASQVDRPQRSLFQTKVLDLAGHVRTYLELMNHAGAHSVPLAAGGENEGARSGERGAGVGNDAVDHSGHVHAVSEPSAGAEAAGAPNAARIGGIARAAAETDWLPLGEVMQRGPAVAGADPDVTLAYANLFRAYNAGDVARFNAAVSELETRLGRRAPDKASVAGFETFFNRAAPFTVSMVFYIAAGLCAMLSWLVLPRTLVRVGVAILVVTLVVHTLGLAARVYISGRPPVTNLYSSAVFIGWGAAILAVLGEGILKHGIGVLTAAVSGFATLLIARGLAADGDTMAVLQAVLDTNFWLATHVVVITLGYSAMYLAGLLGIVYVFRGVFTKTLVPTESRKLAGMVYGVTCFALLMSFVGTILGGIWADQSWGRFWGWDPKENGALMIVLWGALLLHARWGGLVQQRGVAVLAIGGNIITTWSWFGVNQLGAGLHSYGFMDSATGVIMAFVTSQIVIIGIGLLPLSEWRSPLAAKKKNAKDARSAKGDKKPGALGEAASTAG